MNDSHKPALLTLLKLAYLALFVVRFLKNSSSRARSSQKIETKSPSSKTPSLWRSFWTIGSSCPFFSVYQNRQSVNLYWCYLSTGTCGLPLQIGFENKGSIWWSTRHCYPMLCTRAHVEKWHFYPYPHLYSILFWTKQEHISFPQHHKLLQSSKLDLPPSSYSDKIPLQRYFHVNQSSAVVPTYLHRRILQGFLSRSDGIYCCTQHKLLNCSKKFQSIHWIHDLKGNTMLSYCCCRLHEFPEIQIDA